MSKRVRFKSFLLFVILAFSLSACATVNTKTSPSSSEQFQEPNVTDKKLLQEKLVVKEVVVKNADEQGPNNKEDQGKELPIPEPLPTDAPVEEEGAKKGIVFGKTFFTGILKTNFVKLEFKNIADDTNKLELQIGEKSVFSNLQWQEKSVEPGYFFVELPEGEYNISTVSIPVGSTMAVEDMHVNFQVRGDEILYIGTLNMDGTKERIKLGGVPVIKPGFEYTIKILDESEEAKSVFKNKYPEVDKEISVHLMDIKKSGDSPG